MRRPTGDRDFDLRALRLVLDIEYEDAMGEITERRITVHRLVMVQDGGYLECTHIVAFCHLRQDQRTFRADRIREIVDPVTGEVLSDVGAWLQETVAEKAGRRRLAAPPPRETARPGALPDAPAIQRVSVSTPLGAMVQARNETEYARATVEHQHADVDARRRHHRVIYAVIILAGALAFGPLFYSKIVTWEELRPEMGPPAPTCRTADDRPPICGPGRVERGSF